MLRKASALLASALLLFLFAYWLKSFLGVNLLDDFSISQYPPFSAWNAQIIENSPSPGMIINDTFDRTGPLASFRQLWRFRGASMQYEPEPGTPANRVLAIRADSDERWTGNYSQFLRVSPGEHYQYSMRVNMTQPGSYAQASLITYDSNREAISWSNFKFRVTGHDQWLDMQASFSIPLGVSYIKFRLTGAGSGEYRFDDFVLGKL